MSKTVDERVVSMQFDNAHFERNVQTSMSTLDKLKAKLNFKDAGKGLENLNSSVKNVNMTGLGNAVESVRLKFSALEVMGVTALANITNSAVNAGKRIVSALTIDPIKTGFQEYETQINAVQTILANTSSKGTTIDDVNAALEELNKYADKTIYNFTEMTRNIGTFTAAGVDLDTSVSAIQGIANLAAVSGSTSQQASTAMYQLSQALATGTVKLQDWNSVVNAGMGGEVFQEALKRTAKVMGTDVDALIKKYGSFRDSLTQGEWLTTDILTETLNQFTMAAEEGSKEWNEFKASLKEKGYTEEQATAILKMANTATDAATKVKTFTQLWDVLKESAQSGWSQTWKLIIGDFEEAKNLLTPLADFLTGAINKFSEARNKLLESALGRGFTSLAEKITNITKPAQKAAETVQKTVEAVTDLDEIVSKVINGDFGNGEDRINALTEAGQNYYKIQNKVNEALGNSYRHSDEQIAAQDKLLGTTTETTEATEEQTEAKIELTEADKKRIKELARLSDAELKALGYEEEQIAAFRELRNTADQLGIPLGEFIDNLDKIDGRWLLLNSFKNVGQALIKVFQTMAQAWRDVFPPKTEAEKAEMLFNLIAGLHKFTSQLEITGSTTAKLRRTLRGLFALIDIIATITGGALRIAFSTVKAVLSYFNLDILDVTANIGDAIVQFRDWIDSCLDFTGVIETIAPYIKDAIGAISDWVSGIKDAENIPKYILEGLVNGLKAGATIVIGAVIELGKSILEGIKSVLGIHSPSTEFFEIGKNCIEGFVNGIKSFLSKAWDVISNLAYGALEIVSGIDWGAIFGGALAAGMLYVVNNFINLADKFAAPFEGLGSMFESLGGMFEDFGKGLKSKWKAEAFETRSKAILNFAYAIGILAAAVWVLSKIPADDLKKVGVSLLALVGIIAALGLVSLAFSKLKIDCQVGKITGFILTISVGMLLMASVMKKLSKIDGEGMNNAIKGLIAMVLSMAALMFIFGKFCNIEGAGDMHRAGSMILKMSIGLLLMTTVIKRLAKMDSSDIAKGIIVMDVLVLFVMGLGMVSKYAGEYADKAGKMLTKIASAMLIMILVVKLAAKLEADEVLKGLGFVTAVGLLFTALVAVSHFAGQHATKAGSMMLMMSGALLITVFVIKQVSKLKPEAIEKGLKVIAVLEILFGTLIAVSHFAGKNAAKAGTMLLMMSGALLIITGVMFILSKMDPSGLGRALGCITVLELIFGGLIAVTKIAQASEDMGKTLGKMILAIALLSVALVALSFLDPSKLKSATAALSIVMVAFGLLVASTHFAKNTKPMRKTLLQLMGVVILLAGLVAVLSYIDGKKAMPSVTALSILLTAFSAAFAILGKAGRLSTTVTKNLGPMLAIVAGLGLIVAGLSFIDSENTIPNVIALSILLTAMSGAFVILGTAGRLAKGIMGKMGIMVAIVAGLGVIAGILSAFELELSIETAVSLSVLLLAMSGALVILGSVGTLGPAAMSGIGALTVFIGAISAILTILGFLEEITQGGFGDIIDSGTEILSKLGYALGEFVGSILGGFAAGALSGLPEIGTHLSNFMTNLQPFIDGCKNISAEDMAGINELAKAILLITGAELLDSIAGWLTGETSMSDFAEQLASLGTALVGFSAIVSGNIDSKSAEAAANAGLLLANLNDAIPASGGLLQKLGGEKNLDSFSTNIVTFGEAIVEFAAVIGDGVDKDAAESAANAGTMLAKMNDAIPESGGLLQKLGGEKNLDSFSTNIVTFGEAIVAFSNTVKGNVDDDAVEDAADAGAVLAKLADSLPESNGWIQELFGNKDLDTFGEQVEKFGASMVKFSNSVKDGAINADAVENALDVADKLVEFTGDVEGTDLFDWFGNNSLDNFTNQLAGFGTAIATFASKVTGMDSAASLITAINAAKSLATMASGETNAINDLVNTFESLTSIDKMPDNMSKFGGAIKTFASSVAGLNLDSVQNGVAAGKQVVSLANSIAVSSGISKLTGDEGGMSSFGTNLVSFGKAMKDFSGEISGIDTESMSKKVASFRKVTNQMSNIGATLGTGISNSVKGSSSKVNASITTMLNGALKSVNIQKSKFNTAGKVLMTGFIAGLNSMTAKAVSVSSKVSSAAATAVKSETIYNRFYSAGKYCVQGFAAGITAETWRAEAKAKAMASAAEAAAREELDINSPSKVFRAIGYSVPEGFAMGIDRMGYMVTDSSVAMADTAINSMKDSISRIGDAINTDIDAQPTIRPVLDLSNIKSGANSINNMLGFTPSMELMTNVGNISSMMNTRVQNGGNDDVVSAINKLNKSLGNVGNTTYQVNGVTYDDGTNVSEAVKALVRAARVERRM